MQLLVLVNRRQRLKVFISRTTVAGRIRGGTSGMGGKRCRYWAYPDNHACAPVRVGPDDCWQAAAAMATRCKSGKRTRYPCRWAVIEGRLASRKPSCDAGEVVLSSPNTGRLRHAGYRRKACRLRATNQGIDTQHRACRRCTGAARQCGLFAALRSLAARRGNAEQA
jgi:hypothetical protein